MPGFKNWQPFAINNSLHLKNETQCNTVILETKKKFDPCLLIPSAITFTFDKKKPSKFQPNIDSNMKLTRKKKKTTPCKPWQ